MAGKCVGDDPDNVSASQGRTLSAVLGSPRRQLPGSVPEPYNARASQGRTLSAVLASPRQASMQASGSSLGKQKANQTTDDDNDSEYERTYAELDWEAIIAATAEASQGAVREAVTEAIAHHLQSQGFAGTQSQRPSSSQSPTRSQARCAAPSSTVPLYIHEEDYDDGGHWFSPDNSVSAQFPTPSGSRRRIKARSVVPADRNRRYHE